TAAEEASCTAGGCHAREAAEQRHSRHASAVSSPYYRFAAARYARASGDRQALWCQGCHGSSPPVSGEAPAGVGCVSFHRLSAVTSLSGNGRCLRGSPPDGALAPGGWPGSLLLRLRPATHRGAFAPPELAERSEFCAPCHRMGLGVAQNRYKFLRAQDEYGT